MSKKQNRKAAKSQASKSNCGSSNKQNGCGCNESNQSNQSNQNEM